MLCSSKDRREYFDINLPIRKKKAGFTLIELLISIAIIGVLTGIVLVRYGSFNSTTLLKSTAYEISLNIREAQVRSVSASRGGAGFDVPFGVLFEEGKSTYKLTSNGSEFQAIDIGNDMYIHSLCVDSGSCDVDKIDISFKRPEYRSIIHAYNGGSEITGATDAEIKIKSNQGDAIFVVSVSQLGQINVKAE